LKTNSGLEINTFNSTDRILIAGGSGFIGRHLAARCLDDTPYVTCLGLTERNETELLMQDVEFGRADMTEKRSLEKALGGRSFEYVFNLSGYIDHTPYFEGGRKLIESHFFALLNLVDCLDKKRLKGFVQAGSSDEYGDTPAPQRETVRENPISPYSLAKTMASHFIQMLSNTEGFPGVVLRFFLVYGPGQDDKRFLPQVIKNCLKDQSFKSSEGKQLRDFCYVEDVVDAMLKAALSYSAIGHIINVASGTPISIGEVIEKVVNLIGKGKPLWGTHPYRKSENMELYADITLAKKLLNWKPCINIEDGLNKTICYYKNKV
jgi:nucleoside-diphosphate-sugar epimerase